MLYEIRSHPVIKGQLGLFATEIVPKGTIIFNISKLPLINYNTRYAVTKNDKEFYDTTDSGVKYLNHSCDPTLFFDKQQECFITLREISVGEILSFDYLTTEVTMAEPFNCLCGSKNCKGYIAGSSFAKEVRECKKEPHWLFKYFPIFFANIF